MLAGNGLVAPKPQAKVEMQLGWPPAIQPRANPSRMMNPLCT